MDQYHLNTPRASDKLLDEEDKKMADALLIIFLLKYKGENNIINNIERSYTFVLTCTNKIDLNFLDCLIEKAGNLLNQITIYFHKNKEIQINIDLYKVCVSLNERKLKKWVYSKNNYRKLEKNPNLSEFLKNDRTWIHDFILTVYNNDEHISAIETDYKIKEDYYHLYFCNIDHITWSFLKFMLNKYEISNIEFNISAEIKFELKKYEDNIKNFYKRNKKKRKRD